MGLSCAEDGPLFFESHVQHRAFFFGKFMVYYTQQFSIWHEDFAGREVLGELKEASPCEKEIFWKWWDL